MSGFGRNARTKQALDNTACGATKPRFTIRTERNSLGSLNGKVQRLGHWLPEPTARSHQTAPDAWVQLQLPQRSSRGPLAEWRTLLPGMCLTVALANRSGPHTTSVNPSRWIRGAMAKAFARALCMKRGWDRMRDDKGTALTLPSWLCRVDHMI